DGSLPRFSRIYYAPASWGSNRRKPHLTIPCEGCQTRSGGVEVERAAFALLLALLPPGVALLLDRGEVFAGHVSGDVDAVEARGLELGKLRVDRAHCRLERVEVLVDDGVGADLAGDLRVVTSGRNELGARRHVDAVDIGIAHRRRRGSEEHLVGAGLARHLHDLAAGRSPDDRVVDDENVLPLEFEPDHA